MARMKYKCKRPPPRVVHQRRTEIVGTAQVLSVSRRTGSERQVRKLSPPAQVVESSADAYVVHMRRRERQAAMSAGVEEESGQP